MAVTPLTTSQTAYQRTSQMKSMRNSDSHQSKSDGLRSDGAPTGPRDSLTISDPVAFANRVLHDKVIDQLNSYLKDTPGAKLIGEVDPSQVTPDSTANFIVSMATSFYGAYAENHKGEGDQEKLDGFMNLIKGGIDKGFEDARGILDALKVLKTGNIEQDINSTYDLVQKGLDDFYKTQKEMISRGTATTAGKDTDKAAETFGAGND